MRLWVDARREPEVCWVWCRTAGSAIVMLRGGCVERLSLPPDQRDLTATVRDWLIRHGSELEPETHSRSAGVRRHRMMQLRAAL